MNLHEFQAKKLLDAHFTDVPKGKVAETVYDAVTAARSLGWPVVVKAQIHAGGRGKAGGVRIARDEAEVREHAEALLGSPLVTAQTGPEGRVVRRLLIEEVLEIEREFYASIVIDRSTRRPALLLSAAGGVDIEEVARETPEKIITVPIDPAFGLQDFQARRLAFLLGLSSHAHIHASYFLPRLYRAFERVEATQLEVNPWVLSKDEKVLALDAKMSLDDSAMELERIWEARDMRDPTEESPLETEARSHGLNYIKLDGSVGCMVNGAGLAMATMDIVKLAGASPANFLDVGGGASAEQIRNAFRILTSDPEVRVVLINIFGGILRCDRLAKGVIAAVRELDVKHPIVIRLEGTNVEKARRMLAKSGLDFTNADGMRDAADQVVEKLRAAA